VSEIRFDLHAMRYGEIVSADMEGTAYTEEQCAECQYEHRCCELIITSTPAEVAGILQWLSLNSKDVMGISRAIQFRASVLQEHFKKFPGDLKAAIVAWAGKGMKCIFYDNEAKQCSIYPVRPIPCRRMYGQADCRDDNGHGMRSSPDTKEVITARVARFKLHQDMNSNIAEMTTLLANMAISTDQVYVDHEFYSKDPATMTEDQVIFGLAGAPIRNPVALEVDNGRSIRP